MNKKHVHADLITKFAELSHLTDTPHIHFEVETSYGWRQLTEMPLWNSNINYRLVDAPTSFGCICTLAA